jgi:ACS family hexuronate transporter-like MFS transporter
MSATAPAPTAQVGKYRWVICALLFFCSTINYVDRQALSVLKTTLQDALGWTDVDYGWITFAFTVAYAAFPSLIGRVIDRYGVKTSLAAALILWSAMAAAHGLVSTVFGFVLVRFFLGLAEAANFPASIKAVAMWFPQKERALATGIFNSGTNIGVLISVVVVWIAETINWQSSFVAIGLIGVIWLFFWKKAFFPPEEHPRLKPAELAYIQEGRVSAGPPSSCHGLHCYVIGKSGHFCWARCSPIRCGGSICFGCLRICHANAAKIRSRAPDFLV